MTDFVCPHCKRPIHDEEALLCHFCGESLRRSGPGLLGKMSGHSGRWILIAVSFAVGVCFLALSLF